MKTKIITSNKKTVVLEKNGSQYLAISTGLKSKSFKGINTAELTSTPGIIISEGKTENWKVEGFYEINEEMYYYGTYLEGALLSDISFDAKTLSDLVRSFKTINTTDYKTRQFSLSSVIRTNDGKLLYLPPLLTDFLNQYRTEDENLETLYPWNHPELSDDAAQAFTIAGLAYKIICETPAFSGKNSIEIQGAIKLNNYASPLLKEPRLRSEIAELIMESFKGRGSLDQWQKKLNLLKTNGWYDKSISETETADISKSVEKKENKRQLRNKVRIAVIKNRNKIIISAVAVVVLILIIVPIITRALQPPLTMGMNQTEVIRLYYDGFSSLDFESMEDCITTKAGKNDINQIISVTAISKTRSAYEVNSGLLSAEEWKRNGQQPIESQLMLWGLTNINIETISPDVFAVNYEKWAPAQVDDPVSDQPPSARWPEGVLVRDIVHLSMKKEYWKIDSLDRTIVSKINYMENTLND